MLAGPEVALQTPLVSEEARGPHPHGRRRVPQRDQRRDRVKPRTLVQRPHRVESPHALVARDDLLQCGRRRRILALAEHTHRGVAVPLVRMRQQGDELGRGFHREVGVRFKRRVLAAQAVHAAGRGIDLVLIVLTVRDVELVHVAHEERTVGCICDVDWTKGRIRAAHRPTAVGGRERCAGGLTFARDDDIVQRIEGKEHAGVFRGHRRAFRVGAEMREAHHRILRRHHRQFAERVGVARRAELAGVDALHEIEAALRVVPTARVAAIMAGVEPTLGVDLEAVRVATALGEYLVGAGVGMIPPHHATLEINPGRVRRIGAGPRYATGGRTALPAVKPAIEPPHQTVGDGVGVFEAEAGEPHFRRAVGDVVPVGIRVEQEVRRVHHPHSAVAAHRGVGHVEPIEENRALVVHAVAFR